MLGTLETGSGPETSSGLGLVGCLDRGDICHIIPNLQNCTVLTIGIVGPLDALHQTVLHHTIRNGDKVYQSHVLGLVVSDRSSHSTTEGELGSTTGRAKGAF